MSLIFAGSWQELLSEMYMPTARSPASFHHSHDGDVFLQSASPRSADDPSHRALPLKITFYFSKIKSCLIQCLGP